MLTEKAAPELARSTRPDRRRAGPPVARQDGGDWPRTGRWLPWLIAGFLAMLFLVPFDSMQLPIRLPFESKLDRVFLVAIVIAWVAAAMGARAAAPRFRRNPLATPILLFMFVALISLAVNLETLVRLDELGGSAKGFAVLLSYVVFFFVLVTVIRPAEVPAFTALFVGLAALSAVGTIWEYRTEFNAFYSWSDSLLPGFSIEKKIVEIDDIGRRNVTGPTAHGLAITTLLTLAFPFALVGVLQSRELRGKLLSGAAAALIAAATFGTARKTAVFVPMTTVLVLLVYRPRAMLRLLPLGILLLPAIHVLAPGAAGSIRSQLFPQEGFFNQNTVKSRTEDRDATAPDIRNKVALGRGYSSYNPKKYRFLDNQYLGLLIEVGFVGTAAYLLMILAVAWFAHPLVRSQDPIRGPPALAAGAAAIGFGVAGALFDVLAFPQVPYAFMFIAALLVVTGAGRPTRAKPSAVPRGDRLRAPAPQPTPVESAFDWPARQPVPAGVRPGRGEGAAGPPGGSGRRRPARQPVRGAAAGAPPHVSSGTPSSPERSRAHDRDDERVPPREVAREGPRDRRAPRRSRRSTPSRTRFLGWYLLAAGVVAAGAAGFLAASLTSGSDGGAGTQTVRAGGLELTAPADWRRSELPRLSGLGLARPLGLEPKARPGEAGLIAGQVRSTGSGLLPAGFLDQLAKPPPRPDVVRLGGFRAYRYRGATPGVIRRSLSLYVAPRTRGVAVVACFASPPAGRFLADCERVASTLQGLRGSPLPVGPQPGYSRSLAGILDRLSRVRTSQRRRLIRARSPRGQAIAAAALGSSHGAAARSLARVPAGPIERPTSARLVSALLQVRRGYAGLAASARRADRRAFAAARRVVSRSEAKLERELTRSKQPLRSGR